MWIDTYQKWQKATSNSIKTYSEGIAESIQTGNTEVMKKYNQLWKEGWNLSEKMIYLHGISSLGKKYGKN